jgi:hypothetical protein
VNEAYLKSRLCDEVKKLMTGVVVFRHEDKFRGGIPDCSFTMYDRTLWVEVKYRRPGNPGQLTPLQRVTMSNLIRHGRGMVVTYIGNKFGPNSILIEHSVIDNEHNEVLTVAVGRQNFNHMAVAEIIQQELLRP